MAKTKTKPQKNDSKKSPAHARNKATAEGSSNWDETVRREINRSVAPSPATLSSGRERWDDQQLYQTDEKPGVFTPGEMGQPDEDEIPDGKNPQGVQGGRGPLRQEGEGNRQNDQLAELEQDIDEARDLDDRR